MGHVTWQRSFQGRFVICRLGHAMFNPHIKFEMSSTITCNEEIKGNAKCKSFRFEPPFGRLGGNVHGSWKYSHEETLQQTFFDRSWNLRPPFGGLRGNVHSLSMARWKARGRRPISANCTFLPALTVKALWANIGRNCAVWMMVGHVERKFQGRGGRPPTSFGVIKLDSLGYHVMLFAWSYV